MPADITLSKGTYTGASAVTIYVNKIDDSFENKIFQITPSTPKGKQADGPKDTKVVDLLRITRRFKITGFILSNTDKTNLICILEGGGINGGPITMTYNDGGDATSFDVFYANCSISQTRQDEPASSAPDDLAKFEVTIDLTKGISA